MEETVEGVIRDYDNIQLYARYISTIPEPATMTIMIVGIMFCGVSKKYAL